MMTIGKVCCKYASRSNVLGTREVNGRSHGNAPEIGGSRVERDGEWEAGQELFVGVAENRRELMEVVQSFDLALGKCLGVVVRIRVWSGGE